jgi:hypothetical protein
MRNVLGRGKMAHNQAYSISLVFSSMNGCNVRDGLVGFTCIHFSLHSTFRVQNIKSQGLASCVAERPPLLCTFLFSLATVTSLLSALQITSTLVTDVDFFLQAYQAASPSNFRLVSSFTTSQSSVLPNSFTSEYYSIAFEQETAREFRAGWIWPAHFFICE